MTIDEVLQKIQNVNNTALPTYTDLDLNTAKTQAGTQYKSDYDTLYKNAKKSLDLDSERRGIFNSPLAADMMMQKNSQIQGAYDSDVAKLAASLVSDSVSQNQAKRTADLNQRQTELSGLMNLLSALQAERSYGSSGGGGGSTGGNPSTVDTQQMYKYATDALGSVLNGSYSDINTFSNALSDWYNTANSVLGSDIANWIGTNANDVIKSKQNNVYSHQWLENSGVRKSTTKKVSTVSKKKYDPTTGKFR